jgi:hypothetical protein
MHDDSEENTFPLPIRAHEQASLRAEGRAKTAIAEAESRAEAVRSTADARAKEIIAEQFRRVQELASRAHGTTFAPTLSRETIVKEQAGGSLPPAVDSNQFRGKISVHAYYKAEQRGFRSGQEVDDWLEAERELLAVFPLSNRDIGG